MPTKEQHFVPRVYMKAWTTTVETLKDPDIKFSGVYTFSDHTTEGDGANVKSVLWLPHLYTVRFTHRFICSKCPRIFEDFIEKIYKIMREDTIRPVYAQLGYSKIRTKNSIRKHLHEIDDWKFYYEDGNVAKQKAIMSNIQAINSYVLETAFDDLFEKRWEASYNNFIEEVKDGTPVALGQSERTISNQAAQEMLGLFFIMLCRSPYFTAMGIYDSIKANLLYPVFEKICIDSIDKDEAEITEEDRKKAIAEGHCFIDEMMTGIWYSELYRMLFKNEGGFYHNIIEKVMSDCQMILFEAYSDAEHFITSDNPAFEHVLKVTTENMNGFIFPISPQYLLFIAKGSDKFNIVDYRYANSQTVRKFNQIIASHKQELIIADCKYVRTN